MASPNESAADQIMPVKEMKPLLALSKREPVQAAIGLTAAGEGLILLDKKMKPKKVLSTLKAAAAKAKIQLNPSSLRFGKAEVDTEYDAGMVRFFINKEAPGNMRAKLVEVVKQISFQKVELNVDPSFEDEPEDGDAPAPQTTASAPPSPPPEAPAPSAALLKGRLTDNVKKIPEVLKVDPSRKDALMQLATAAQKLIAVDDYDGALHSIEDLEAALGQTKLPTADPLAGVSGSGAVAYGKSRMVWTAVQKQTMAGVEKLRDAVLDAYKESPLLGDIRSSYADRVEKKFAVLDTSLNDLLDAAQSATDPNERAAKVQAAQDKIKQYKDFLAAEKTLIDEVDSNPFVPVSIGPVLSKTLDTLAAAVR